jgi:nucleoside-diphosphate-sugar epimerase/intein/homing endonuclease
MSASRQRKWIVTGGAGFIGCHAASRFHQAGHRVVAVDNLSRPGADRNLAWLRAQGVEDFVRLDVRDASGLHDLLARHADADAVLHLAGQVAVTTSVANPRADFETNALGTLNVLEAVRLAAGGRPAVLYSSTNKVYGHLDHVRVVERDGRYAYEDRPFGVDESEPLDFHSPYGCSKGAGDQYVRDYARIYGMKTVSFRQSCLAGDQEVVTPFGNKPISALRDGELVHSGRGWTKVVRVRQTGVKPVRRLSTMGGLSVTLTEDHRMVRPHGLFGNRDFAYGDFLAVLPEARHLPRWEPIPDRLLDPSAYLDAVKARTSDRRCLNEAARVADRLLPLRGDAFLAVAEIAGRLFGDGHLGRDNRQSREAPAYTVQHFGTEAELIEVGRRLGWLGLPAGAISRWEAVSTLPGGHTIRGYSCRIQQQSIPIFTLFEMIGVPVGDKVRVDYEMPGWVRSGHPLLKRAFLRGFLGAELCKVQPDSCIAPSFAQSKDVESLDNGRLWIRQLRDLLGEFGIETSCFEATPIDYKRGSTVQTTVRLLGGRQLYPRLAAVGYGLNGERSGRLNALLRWQATNTTPEHFERTFQLYQADGELLWDSLASIEPLGDRPVYDLEVEDESHLFVAGGIQVSNCIFGTRQFGIEDQGWVAWFCLAATRGQRFTIFGDGKQIRDTLWIDDLIDAYQTALERIDEVKGEVFNLGGGPSNTLSLLELVAALERHFGRPMDPAFAGWRPGDQPVFVADIRKAGRLLDWSPQVSTADGVARLLAWIGANQGLFAP